MGLLKRFGVGKHREIRNCHLELEHLEPRILLSATEWLGGAGALAVEETSAPPFAGAVGNHYSDPYLSFLWGASGSKYDPDGSIDAEAGVIDHSAMAWTKALGQHAVFVWDSISQEFTVDRSGAYAIQVTCNISGGVWSTGGAYLLGYEWGDFDVDLSFNIWDYWDTRFYDEFELFHEENSALDVFGAAAWENFSTLFDAVSGGGPALLASFLEDVADYVPSLDPLESWADYQVILAGTAYLQADTTYHWSFAVDSSVVSNSVGFSGHEGTVDLVVSIEDVSMTYVGGNAPPILEDLSCNRGLLVHGDTLTLTAEGVLDPDGNVEGVWFYRDSNSNGSWDGSDELLGTDTNSAGGWQWQGTVAGSWGTGSQLFFAKARDNNGAWSNITSTRVMIAQELAAFAITGQRWDDGGGLGGDGDGVMEAGESVRLKLRLSSSADVQNLDAFLSTTDPDISITDGYVYYDSFGAGDSQWCVGWFEMGLNFSGDRTSSFTVRVTYESNGQRYYQDIDFSANFYDQGSYGTFEVRDFTVDDAPSISERNDGDGVFESGEKVHIIPTIHYSGLAPATHIDVSLSEDSPVDMHAGDKRYPEMDPGDNAVPASGGYFVAEAPRTFAGTVSVDMQIVWEESSTSQLIEDAFDLVVAPAGWLGVAYEEYDFSVVAPGEDVRHTVRLCNYGTGPLTVSGISISNPDTTTDAAGLPWTLEAGQSKDVVVTLETAGIESGTRVERTVTFLTSDGRVDDEDNVVWIRGLVSRSVPLAFVPDMGTLRFHPDISGDWIVWEENRFGNTDIFAYNVSTGEELQVTNDPWSQGSPYISGSLIAWEDWRNDDGSYTNADIYAYDINTGETFVVAADPADEDLLGVDGDLIAFVRDYFVFTERTNISAARNLYVVEYQGAGSLAERYSSGFTDPGYHATKQTIYGEGDFGDGLLVYEREEVYWETQYTHDYWTGRNQRIEVIDFAASHSTPTVAVQHCSTYLAASEQGFVFVEEYEDPISGERGDQVWLWQDGSIRRLTDPGPDGTDHASDILA
ncbi:MAG: hypothetical protein ACTSPX_02765, partial [Candidatus Thorarchaeota archaeon]